MQPTSTTQRALGALVALATGSTLSVSTALADPAPGSSRPVAQPRTPAPALPPAPAVVLAPLDARSVPDACRALARQAQAPNPATALPARVPLANCISEHAIAPLQLCDCGASIEDINRAVAPAFALLDDVSAKAEPAIQLLAEHAKGQLYTGFTVRMRATVPKLGTTSAQSEAALRDVRARTLEAQLTPWHEAAVVAFQRVVEIGTRNPQLASNPAVVTALRDSQQRLPPLVAVVGPNQATNEVTNEVANEEPSPAPVQAAGPAADAPQPPSEPVANDAVYHKR